MLVQFNISSVFALYDVRKQLFAQFAANTLQITVCFVVDINFPTAAAGVAAFVGKTGKLCIIVWKSEK